jgi:hypothetical protein
MFYLNCPFCDSACDGDDFFKPGVAYDKVAMCCVTCLNIECSYTSGAALSPEGAARIHNYIANCVEESEN